MIILKNIPLYALSDFIRHCNEQLWKNIAETKSFLWVVLALEKWLPKTAQVFFPIKHDSQNGPTFFFFIDMWKNIVETKSFLWVVLALENGCPKVESMVICDVILCGGSSM